MARLPKAQWPVARWPKGVYMSVPYDEEKLKKGLALLRKRRKKDAETFEKDGTVNVRPNPFMDDPEYKDKNTEILKEIRKRERKGDIPFKVDPGYKTGGTVMCRGNGRARTRPTKLR